MKLGETGKKLSIMLLMLVGAGALVFLAAIAAQRIGSEQTISVLEAAAVLISREGPENFLDDPSRLNFDNSARIRIALLDKHLTPLKGKLIISSKAFQQDAMVALKTGIMVSGRDAAYVIIPLKKHVLALQAPERSLADTFRVLWPALVLVLALVSLIFFLIQNGGFLTGKAGQKCIALIREIAGDTDGSLEPESLVEEVRKRWILLEQDMQTTQFELGRYKNQLEDMKRALRKTTQDLETIQGNLIQAGTLTALGEFAAGMSHELNNPLGIVLGFTQHLLDEFPSDHPHYSKLKRMETELERCQKIIQDLLSFARPAIPALEKVDVNKLIQESVQFACFTKPEGIEVVLDLQSGLPPITADPDQLEQVLLNLLKNALEAMPNVGRLQISATLSTLSKEECLQLSIPMDQSGGLLLETGEQGKSLRTPRLNSRCKPGSPAVIIEIKDSGQGIDPENIQKVFTPFFTTKKRQGTGLGLSICWKLVRKNGGLIKVRSEKGKETVFTLLFPVREGVI